MTPTSADVFVPSHEFHIVAGGLAICGETLQGHLETWDRESESPRTPVCHACKVAAQVAPPTA